MRLWVLAFGVLYVIAPAAAMAAEGVTNKLELAGPCVVGVGGPCNGDEVGDSDTGGRSAPDAMVAPGQRQLRIEPNPGHVDPPRPFPVEPLPCTDDLPGCVKPFPVEPVPEPHPQPRPTQPPVQPEPAKPMIYKDPGRGGGTPRPVWGTQ